MRCFLPCLPLCLQSSLSYLGFFARSINVLCYNFNTGKASIQVEDRKQRWWLHFCFVMMRLYLTAVQIVYCARSMWRTATAIRLFLCEKRLVASFRLINRPRTTVTCRATKKRKIVKFAPSSFCRFVERIVLERVSWRLCILAVTTHIISPGTTGVGVPLLAKSNFEVNVAKAWLAFVWVRCSPLAVTDA